MNQPGFTTPNVNNVGGPRRNSRGTRASNLPRPGTAARGGGSARKDDPLSNPGSAVFRGTKRPSLVGRASGVSRLSGTGRLSGIRLSTADAGGPSGGRGKISLSTVRPSLAGVGRTTPSRNPLTVANLIPPSVGRLSTESRASVSGRGSRKDPRQITDPTFKKECVDTILEFFADQGYCSPNCEIPSRKMVTHPTTKDFTSMFTFIYGKIHLDYGLPARFEEEVIRIMKSLSYPGKISKSTLITIGSTHTWPHLLAMLAWLCDLVTDVLHTNISEMAFPARFEETDNLPWEMLCYYKEGLHNKDDMEQEEFFQSFTENRLKELHLDNESFAALEAESAAQQKEQDKVAQQKEALRQLQSYNVKINDDLEKVEKYNLKLDDKLHSLHAVGLQHQQELFEAQAHKLKLEEELSALAALHASQKFTSSELYRMKHHTETFAVVCQELTQEQKLLQEKIWSLEMTEGRSQVALTAAIQKYNDSPAAALVGAITCPGVDAGSTGSLAARLVEPQLQELGDRLREAVKSGRNSIMEERVAKGAREKECRKWEQLGEEKKQQVAQLTMQVTNLEEDIAFTKQEQDREEAALLQQCGRYQAEAAALRAKPRPDIHAKRQQIAVAQEQVQLKSEEFAARTRDVGYFLAEVMKKVEEQLRYEESLAKELLEVLTSNSI